MQVDFSSNCSNLLILFFYLTIKKILPVEFYGLIYFICLCIHQVNASDKNYIFY